MKTIWLFIPALIVFFGCHSGSESMEDGRYDVSANNADYRSKDESQLEGEPTFYANATPQGFTNVSFADANSNDKPNAPTIKMPDKIIKTGFVEMELDDYAKRMAEIANRVKAAQGYISNQNEQRDHYHITNTLSIRVVNQNFDDLINGLGDIAKNVVSKSVDMQDVSEEYTDLAARLKTKREVENRYLDILKNAKTIKDILLVEEQLRTIREEIESSEARLKFLDDRVSYSTITLQVFENLEYTAPASMQANFGQKILKAVTTGWNGILEFAIGLATIWPLLLIIGAGLFVVVRKIRHRRAVA